MRWRCIVTCRLGGVAVRRDSRRGVTLDAAKDLLDVLRRRRIEEQLKIVWVGGGEELCRMTRSTRRGCDQLTHLGGELAPGQ